MSRAVVCLSCIIVLAWTNELLGGGEKLYGVHWWDYARPAVGSGPTGGWSVETVLTNSDPWWQGWYFEPLYQQVSSTHNASIVTRIDYNWGQTVPAPSSSTALDWANKIVSDVIGPLGPYAARWIIGNEPNIIGEGNGWASNQITPAGYAQIYHTVRQVIKAARPQDEVLFAPVSPGGVIDGVRWKDGGEWLAEAIDATLALPGGAIDGLAIHAYGNPFVGAAQAVAEFHDSYVSQLAVIDSCSLLSAPVYLTEWNRATATSGNLAANEQVSADFLRQSLVDVDHWNRIPGNHNIRSMAWFVNEGYGGWQEFSLEWWRSQGNPEGHAGDLWTALLGSADLPAGFAGTRPLTDYNSDGLLDNNDWIAWRNNFGRTAWVYADGNRNGFVDAADYVLWRKSLQAGGGSPAVGVPEPDTIRQLAAGLAGMWWFGGKRRLVYVKQATMRIR
ncbi:MAG: glycosyl hydrolase [Pirellulales bacterium]